MPEAAKPERQALESTVSGMDPGSGPGRWGREGTGAIQAILGEDAVGLLRPLRGLAMTAKSERELTRPP